MNIGLLVITGASVFATLTSSSLLWFQSDRGRKQVEAKDAQALATASFTFVTKQMKMLRAQADSLVAQLNVSDQTQLEMRLRNELEKLEAACTSATTAFTAYQKSAHADPSAKDSRGNYRRMISVYTTLHEHLQAAFAPAGFNAVYDDISDNLSIVADARTLFAMARLLLQKRSSQGWNVDEIERDLHARLKSFTYVQEARATNPLAKHHTLLSDIRRGVQGHVNHLEALPQQHESFNAKQQHHRHAFSVLLHDIKVAEVVIVSLQNLYQPACFAKVIVDFEVAKQRIPHIEDMLDSLSAAINPRDYNWEQADAFDTRLAELIGDSTASCQAIMAMPDRLEKELTAIRKRVQSLDTNLREVTNQAQQRRGEQKDVIRALQKVSERLGQLAKATTKLKPDVLKLAADLEYIEQLSTLIDQVSAQRQTGDKANDLKAVTRVAMTALGMDETTD